MLSEPRVDIHAGAWLRAERSTSVTGPRSRYGFNRTVKHGGERSIDEIPRLPMGVMRGNSLLLAFPSPFPRAFIVASFCGDAVQIGCSVLPGRAFLLLVLSRPTLGARYRRAFFGGPMHRRCSLADRDPWL